MSDPDSETPETRETPARVWTAVESLRDSQLDELVADLNEIDQGLGDLADRRGKIRSLIGELIQPLGFPVTGLPSHRPDRQKQLIWHPASTIQRLDRAKLVQAGVLPEQLKAGTIEGLKTAYLEVRDVKLAEGSDVS